MTVPVHIDDYTVFRSPLSDFCAEVAHRDVRREIRPVTRGERIALGRPPAVIGDRGMARDDPSERFGLYTPRRYEPAGLGIPCARGPVTPGGRAGPVQTLNCVEVANGVTCIECGDEILEERAQLGYRYCTKAECQAVHYRGLAITAIGVNKSADSFIVADADEIRRRGEAGEFAKKDTTLGLDYHARPTAPAVPAAAHSRARVPEPRPVPPRRPWTAEQEKIVRLYHGMGLNPRQIAERARETVPRLGITERLATQIMSAPPRR
jgi:hypothetical protein